MEPTVKYPKISIAIPIHPMKNWQLFLTRCLESIYSQTFTDYEIIITKAGKMAENTNAAINACRGELIKVLYMDDWLSHDGALQEIVDAMEGSPKQWLITGASTNPNPRWTDDIEFGNNKLGSPSALTIRHGVVHRFDEHLSWLLDCDLYRRLYNTYGEPLIVPRVNVNIGVHEGQMTNILSDEQKINEHAYLEDKYNQRI